MQRALKSPPNALLQNCVQFISICNESFAIPVTHQGLSSAGRHPFARTLFSALRCSSVALARNEITPTVISCHIGASARCPWLALSVVTRPAYGMRTCNPIGKRCRSSFSRTAWTLCANNAPSISRVVFPFGSAPTKPTSQHPTLASASATDFTSTAESDVGDVVENARGARGRRSRGAGATSVVAPLSAADLAAANLLSDEALRTMGIQLPTHCCGCGMKLQRQDENAPG